MLQTTSLLTISKGDLTHPNSSAGIQILQTTSLLPISKEGVLPTQTPVHDSRCCKPLLPYPIARGESYPPKLQGTTPDVANHLSPVHWQGGSLTHPNSSALLQMLQTTSLLLISKEGVLLTQTPVHDSRCCKPLLSCP